MPIWRKAVLGTGTQCLSQAAVVRRGEQVLGRQLTPSATPPPKQPAAAGTSRRNFFARLGGPMFSLALGGSLPPGCSREVTVLRGCCVGRAQAIGSTGPAWLVYGRLHLRNLTVRSSVRAVRNQTVCPLPTKLMVIEDSLPLRTVFAPHRSHTRVDRSQDNTTYFGGRPQFANLSLVQMPSVLAHYGRASPSFTWTCCWAAIAQAGRELPES